MKKIIYILMLGLAVAAASCQRTVNPVDITLQLTIDNKPYAASGALVSLKEGDVSFEATTNEGGSVSFSVMPGAYEASASFRQTINGEAKNFNGTASVLVVENTPRDYNINLTVSASNPLIIKECYNGGCMDNENAKNYANDKYIVVYNNSGVAIDASNLCIAMGPITVTEKNSKYYSAATGKHSYEAEGWCPASYAIWWFKKEAKVIIKPYSQIVVSIMGAVDHTETYKNSVDLSNADYCMYHPESGFTNETSYPAPSKNIPTENYMQTYVFGMGLAWPFPMVTAAPFLILPDRDIEAFVKDAANFDNKGTNASANFCKVPQSWISDALGIFTKGSESSSINQFPSNIDAAAISFESKKGYTVYRNVDKEATEALAGNKDKLVYNYAGQADGFDGDPSGIDAEASIAAGAKIIYKDTNNSKADFHIRKVASIKK